jgi:predicted ester cyclase
VSDENKAIVKRFYEEISKGNLDVVDEVISDDLVEHDEFPGLEHGKAGVRKMFALMHDAFESYRVEAGDVFADGDMVIVRAVMKGRHIGEFLGIAPTGNEIAVPFADFIRMVGGQCVEHWGVTDTGIMMQRLGQADA